MWELPFTLFQLVVGVGRDPGVELPVMPCCLAFPGMPCPLHVFEPQFRGMSGNIHCATFVILIVICFYLRAAVCWYFGFWILDFQVGTIVQVTNYETLPDGRLLIDTKGCERIRVLNERVVNGLTNVRFEFYRDLPVEEEDSESEALIYFKHFTLFHDIFVTAYRSLSATVHSMASEWLAAVPCRTRASLVPFFGPLPSVNSCPPEGDTGGPVSWIWWLVAVLPLNETCRYKLLSCRKPLERLNKLKEILNFLSSGQWKSDGSCHCPSLSC
ncbi:LON peptidase N-terminal domain and RING finger protein 2 [Fasciolopsis buskii]|uniref:LON peptidase N-terminal domain and RING finger protein 2 n=1 Tax=Fasciolopsis buskii TaxID=27845 RepID=A0A8E0S5I4_9TREM|nr:LON peptidase N-terminal domain and RING finger protein 2 [Fasciolopsis buski]